MSNLNKTLLIGRVGQDPRITDFTNGEKAAGFTIATSRRWKTANGEQKEATEWHNVVVYGRVVDVIQKYVRKGDLLYVEGEGRNRKYTSDGVERTIHEVVVTGFEGRVSLFPKPNPERAAAAAIPPPNQSVTIEQLPSLDDLPFD